MLLALDVGNTNIVIGFLDESGIRVLSPTITRLIAAGKKGPVD